MCVYDDVNIDVNRPQMVNESASSMGDRVNTNCLQECARSELIVRLTINLTHLF